MIDLNPQRIFFDNLNKWVTENILEERDMTSHLEFVTDQYGFDAAHEELTVFIGAYCEQELGILTDRD